MTRIRQMLSARSVRFFQEEEKILLKLAEAELLPLSLFIRHLVLTHPKVHPKLKETKKK